MDRTSLSCVRVRKNAVPTIFKSYPKHLQPKPVCKRKMPEYLNEKECPNISPNILKEQQKSADEEINTPEEGSLAQPGCSSTPDTPRKAELKRKLSISDQKLCASRKKIKALQQSKRRLKKKVATLNAVLDELRSQKILSEDRLNILENCMTGSSAELFNRQLAKCKTPYSSQLRAFATTLHFYSPTAYNYVRQVFDTCLPHPRTILRWYEVVDALPGFTQESLNFLKQYNESAKNSGKDLLCSLLMDEVTIRKHIEFDGKNHFGYVNMGSEINNDSAPVAKEALVFMAVAVNDSWKIPVGYFFVDALTSEEKVSVVRNCLSLLHETGMKVISMTFDGTATNLAMARHLGCSLDPFSNFKTYFENPATGEHSNHAIH